MVTVARMESLAYKDLLELQESQEQLEVLVNQL